MVYVNKIGKRRRNYAHSLQYSQTAIFSLTLPADFVHEITAQYSAYR
jgi:hypothetical protein